MPQRRPITCARTWRIGVLVALAGASAAWGQEPLHTEPGTITGSVIDASTGSALRGSTITLTPAGLALLADHRDDTRLALAISSSTSASGVYRFVGLPAGTYHLRVQRIGYSPVTITVELGGSGAPPLSIGLVVAPVRLHAVEVRASRAAAVVDHAPDTPNERVVAAHAREREFLSTDTHELGIADLDEAATLGGRDLLRAMQRLPGVTAFDDWSAKLWVRGNRWDHNRVYYDGLPLFDPLSALGRGTGVSADAIGGALLHPGVRPVSLGGEGATRIDLRSRPASGSGAWHGTAEVTRFGFGGDVERQSEDQSAGFVLTAQHSLGGWVPPAVLDHAFGGDRFTSDAQATMRADVSLSQEVWLETSALVNHDAHLAAENFTLQDWGNAAARATLGARVGAVSISHTLGVSHFASSSGRWFGQPSASGSSSVPGVSDPVVSSVDYVTFDGRADMVSGAGARTSAGYSVVAQRSSFGGPNAAILWGRPTPENTTRHDALAYASTWASHRAGLGSRAEMEAGVRLDAGGSSRLETLRPAGSAQLRVSLTDNASLSAGAARTYQYVQSIDLPAVSQGMTSPSLWVTSGGDVPAMSIDNAMIGIEAWGPATTLLAANAYVRHTLGAVTADPTPGVLVDRPLFVAATEAAHGVELSVRKLAGRATGLVAYSYGSSMTTARGLSFPSPADRTHAVDVAGAVRFGSLRATTAFTLTSGAPYTRTIAESPPFSHDAPDAQRLPPYRSLDFSLDYTRAIGRASLVGFVGVQNAGGRHNFTWYEYSVDCAKPPSLAANERCVNGDVIHAPVGATPTIGLRVVY